jgi:hypothetical protein
VGAGLAHVELLGDGEVSLCEPLLQDKGAIRVRQIQEYVALLRGEHLVSERQAVMRVGVALQRDDVANHAVLLDLLVTRGEAVEEGLPDPCDLLSAVGS